MTDSEVRFSTVAMCGAALMRQGATDGTFATPVSGWYENVDGQWTLIEERDVPECPRLQHRSAS